MILLIVDVFFYKYFVCIHIHIYVYMYIIREKLTEKRVTPLSLFYSFTNNKLIRRLNSHGIFLITY